MSKKILIVDDDCNFVQRILNSYCHEGAIFSIADSLKRASDLLSIDSFDLIIANSKVPGGSSLILKKLITSKTQILFLSGIDSEYENIKNSGELCFHKYDLNNNLEELFSNA